MSSCSAPFRRPEDYVHWNVNTETFVASATGRVAKRRRTRCPVPRRRRDKEIGASRRHPESRWGLRTISVLVVVEDGQASTSSSCLDLASQALSANVSAFTFQRTKSAPPKLLILDRRATDAHLGSHSLPRTWLRSKPHPPLATASNLLAGSTAPSENCRPAIDRAATAGSLSPDGHPSMEQLYSSLSKLFEVSIPSASLPEGLRA